MEVISEVLARLGSSHTHNSPHMTPQQADNLVINYVFQSITSICAAHRQAFDTQDKVNAAKLEWMKTFKLANLDSVRAIERGLNKLRLMPSPFMPTAGYFVSLCQEKEQPPLYKPYAKIDAPRDKDLARKILSQLISDLKA